MQVAALYDVHGNLPALEAVVSELERESPDVILFGGDMVSGPLPRETFDLIASLGERVRLLLGNADRWFLDVHEGREHPEPEDAWLIEQLDIGYRSFFAALPRRIVLQLDGLGEALFCHGSPRSEDEIITATTSEDRLRAMLSGVEARVVVCGHTHVQFDRIVDGVRVINAGSVGMPYEDEPGARWAMLGPEVDFRRTPYDLSSAAQRIGESGWGRASHFIERYLFDPPSAAEATEHFEQVALERDRVP